jgi:TonB-dependent receptor
MFGSDPAAYAAIGNTTIIPALITLQQQTLKQKRAGFTSSLQWKPTENTKVTFDGLYAQFKYDTQSDELGTFGLNRHNDNARAEIGLTNSTTGLRPYTTSSPLNYFADRYGSYAANCLETAATSTAPGLNCSGTAGTPGVSVLPTAQYYNPTTHTYVSVPAVLATTSSNGNVWSTNPYNLVPYDYYNNPNSVGYNAAAAAADPRGILMYDQLVGKEHAILSGAHVNSAGQADYLAVDRMDWDSVDAYSTNNTIFTQYDFTLDQRFNDRFTMKFVYGSSFSHLRVDGGRVDMYSLDQNGYVFDARGGGAMPEIKTGFNAADVNQWGDVKGYSSVTRYIQTADNTYKNARVDFDYVWNEHLTFDFGYSTRTYGYAATASTMSRPVLPTIAEFNKYGVATNNSMYANLTLAQLGHVTSFGSGLNLPAGTTTAWWAPNRDDWEKVLGYTCNCINQFGDFRVNPTLGSGLTVTENDNGTYGQANFNLEVLGRTLRGNAGVRVATTDVTSSSYGTTGAFNAIQLTGNNKYTDTLPSLNLDYELTDTFMIRFAAAKTMARPSLNLLGPGVTSLSIGALPDSSANIPKITLGNPALKPYRAANYNLNFEWYFNKSSLLSLAFYQKALTSFPRVVTNNVKLSDILPAGLHQQIQNSLTPDQQTYMSGDDIWSVTTATDTPGGVINGIELQYQQPLTFLPKPFDGLGVQFNATHIQSKLGYLNQDGSAGTAPWPYASPTTLNFTLYYEKGPWQARIAGTWRARFATVFPQSTGTCSPGLTTSNGGYCSAPYNGFNGEEAQAYWDFKETYSYTKNIKWDISVQNITSTDSHAWNYVPSVVQDYRSSGGTIISTAIRFTY